MKRLLFVVSLIILGMISSNLAFADGEALISPEEKEKEVVRLRELSTDDLIAELENTASKAVLCLEKTKIDILISLMAQELCKRGERRPLPVLYNICKEGKTQAVTDVALAICRIETKNKDIGKKVEILEKFMVHRKPFFQYASAQVLKELNCEKAIVILKKYAKTNSFAKKSMLELEVNGLSDEETAKRLLEILKADIVEGNVNYTIAYNILIDMGRKGKKISSAMLMTLNSLKNLDISKENKEKLTDLIVNGVYAIKDKEAIGKLTEDQKKYWHKQKKRREELRDRQNKQNLGITDEEKEILTIGKENDASKISRLVEYLRHNNKRVYSSAIRTLECFVEARNKKAKEILEQNIAELFEATGHSDNRLAERVAMLISSLEIPKVAKIALKNLNSSNQNKICAAMYILGKKEAIEALPHLIKFMDNDSEAIQDVLEETLLDFGIRTRGKTKAEVKEAIKTKIEEAQSRNKEKEVSQQTPSKITDLIVLLYLSPLDKSAIQTAQKLGDLVINQKPEKVATKEDLGKINTAVEKLIELCSKGPGAEYVAAKRQLERLWKFSVPKLVENLSSEVPKVQEVCVETLVLTRDEEIIQTMIEKCKKETDPIKKAPYLRGLGMMMDNRTTVIENRKQSDKEKIKKVVEEKVIPFLESEKKIIEEQEPKDFIDRMIKRLKDNMKEKESPKKHRKL